MNGKLLFNINSWQSQDNMLHQLSLNSLGVTSDWLTQQNKSWTYKAGWEIPQNPGLSHLWRVCTRWGPDHEVGL